jgi:hypothetical protein
MAKRPIDKRRRLSGTIQGIDPPDSHIQPGMTWAVSASCTWGEHGRVHFVVPSGVTLLLEAAEDHLRRSERLRTRLPNQLRHVRSPEPGLRNFTNQGLLYDFFREAMAGVVLTHGALDNFANDHLPPDLQMTDEKGVTHDRAALQRRGIEWRLSKVMAEATGRPNLKTFDTVLWQELLGLKGLRDEIHHVAAGSTMHTSATEEQSVYAQLLRADLLRLYAVAVQVIEHYEPARSGRFS